MADDRLRKAWHARERSMPISTVLNFTRDGLVLGAGTVLVAAGETPRQLKNLEGEEPRLLALLCAAYGRAVPPSVLSNIERAAKAWRAGDDCLAYIHLAHARLGELQYPHDAAQRLVIVNAFLKAGGSPRIIFEALKVGRAYIDVLEKFYNPDEPRVPAGSGRTSGEWTRDGEAAKPPSGEPTHEAEAAKPSPLSYLPPAYLAPGAASWLGDLAPTTAASLGEYALGLLSEAAGAVAAFGLIFIPSNKNVATEGDVEGVPGLRYSWNPDERLIHLIYASPDGTHRIFSAAWAYMNSVTFRGGSSAGCCRTARLLLIPQRYHPIWYRTTNRDCAPRPVPTSPIRQAESMRTMSRLSSIHSRVQRCRIWAFNCSIPVQGSSSSTMTVNKKQVR